MSRMDLRIKLEVLENALNDIFTIATTAATSTTTSKDISAMS